MTRDRRQLKSASPMNRRAHVQRIAQNPEQERNLLMAGFGMDIDAARWRSRQRACSQVYTCNASGRAFGDARKHVKQTN